MRIVCSWCSRNMGEKEPLSDKSISHSICKPCEMLAELKDVLLDNIKNTESLDVLYMTLNHVRQYYQLKNHFSRRQV